MAERYVESEKKQKNNKYIPCNILHLHFKRVNETCFNIHIYLDVLT